MQVKLSKVVVIRILTRSERKLRLSQRSVMNLEKSWRIPGEGCNLGMRNLLYRVLPDEKSCIAENGTTRRRGRKLPEAANHELVAPTRDTLSGSVENNHRRTAANEPDTIQWSGGGLMPSCTSVVKFRCSPEGRQRPESARSMCPKREPAPQAMHLVPKVTQNYGFSGINASLLPTR